jgi:nicotinamidase-related amidase
MSALAKKGFVAIDVQNAWARTCPITTNAIEKKADQARRRGQPVIWAYMDFLPPDMKPMRFGDLKATEIFRLAMEHDPKKGTLYLPTITPHDQDWITSKGKLSLFSNAANELFLRRKLKLDGFEAAGFRTGQCFSESCVEGVSAGFNVSVDSNLTADYRDRWQTNIEHVFANTGIILDGVHLRAA